MGVYDDQINTAFESIKAKGRLVSITQSTPGAYNPATGSTASATTSVISLYGVTLPATQGRIESFEIRYEDTNNLINREFRFLMLAAKDAGFTPKQNDVVNLDGSNYSIMGVTRLSINGEDILYKVGIFK